jgi:hypothetical protein
METQARAVLSNRNGIQSQVKEERIRAPFSAVGLQRSILSTAATKDAATIAPAIQIYSSRLWCKSKKGTPKRAKIPTLMANETGTMAAPERCSPKNPRTSITPGTMNKKSVPKKGMRGGSAKVDRRGPIRTKVPALRRTT